ncbi:MAG: Fe-S protein assembly co-chaperone HscB [Betaproteobacteria bacterium]|nr:Fe-S protein assembly co-chaperone HscB [Betaproteobacteria bacterium]
MTPDFHQNHFAMFGLEPKFNIDMARLDSAFRKLQGEVHPDRFAGGSDAEKRVSMQWAMRANEAYQTLKRPIARARYLLSLAGVDTQEEVNTSMPADFLMQQMAWREAVADAKVAKDAAALDSQVSDLRKAERALQVRLAAALDERPDHAGAAEIVRKLRFIEKLAEEISLAQEALEN